MRPHLQREDPRDRRRPSQASAVGAVPHRARAGRRSNSPSAGEGDPDVPICVRSSGSALGFSIAHSVSPRIGTSEMLEAPAALCSGTGARI